VSGIAPTSSGLPASVIANVNGAVATSNAVALGVAGGGAGGTQDISTLWTSGATTSGFGADPANQPLGWPEGNVIGGGGFGGNGAADGVDNLWNSGATTSGFGADPANQPLGWPEGNVIGGGGFGGSGADGVGDLWSNGATGFGADPANQPLGWPEGNVIGGGGFGGPGTVDGVNDLWTGSTAPGFGSDPANVPLGWPQNLGGPSGGGFGATSGATATGGSPAATTSQGQANNELLPLVNELQNSATGRNILAQLRATNTKIELVPAAEFRQTHDAQTLAVFDSGSNTITLQREQVLANPGRTALTFAHEATHAIDDSRIDGALAAGYAAAKQTANPAASYAQSEFEVHMAAEARAYRNEAQTALDLGLDPRTTIGLTPAVDPATGGVRDFATTWMAV
jgi:hypothetical protein